MQVQEVMNRELALCSPDDDIREALKVMGERQRHRLAVVDKDESLQGILSLDDIVLKTEADGLAKDLLKTLKAICDRKPRAAAAG